MWKAVRVAAPLLLVIALVVASFGAGYSVSLLISAPSPTPPGLNLVEEAWQLILEDFVDKDELDPKELSCGAIKGLLDVLDDPYSAYFDAEQYELKQSSLEGAFDGIGAVVNIDDEQLTVVAPIEGTPAEMEGIMPRDRILEIDGESTEGMSLTEAVLRIRGERGTQVTLRVLHQDEETPEDIVITREEIKVDSVYLEMLPHDIAHIRLTHFSDRTNAELASALEEILAKDAVGIILDLRDNPGGILEAAVAVASQFLKEGCVLYAVDSEGQRETWNVKEGRLATDPPLAVLVNGNSASASEVVAGALQDHGRAPLIGTKTLGKGSVNHFHQLSDGSAIYITFSRWYTPNGRQIEGYGLSPDDEVERTTEDIEQGNDPQLDRAIEYIRSQL